MNLFDIGIEEEVIIKNINIFGKEKRRLYDLGIIPGVKIKKMFKSIFNDPIAYSLKDTCIALRSEITKNIEVENG